MYRDSQQRSDNESGQINRISASALRMREIFQSFQFLVVFANEYPLGLWVHMPAARPYTVWTKPYGTSYRYNDNRPLQGQVFPRKRGPGRAVVDACADFWPHTAYAGQRPAHPENSSAARRSLSRISGLCRPEARASRKPRKLASPAAGAGCLSGSLCCFITSSSQRTRS